MWTFLHFFLRNLVCLYCSKCATFLTAESSSWFAQLSLQSPYCQWILLSQGSLKWIPLKGPVPLARWQRHVQLHLAALRFQDLHKLPNSKGNSHPPHTPTAVSTSASNWCQATRTSLFSSAHHTKRAMIGSSWPSLIVYQKYQKTNYPQLTCRCCYQTPYNNKDKYLSCHLRGNGIWFFKSDDSDIIISQQLWRQRQRKKIERI